MTTIPVRRARPGETWDVPISELAPGDVIVGDHEEIAVSLVETEPERVVVTGRITAGYGRGPGARTWRYRWDHRFPTVLKAKR